MSDVKIKLSLTRYYHVGRNDCAYVFLISSFFSRGSANYLNPVSRMISLYIIRFNNRHNIMILKLAWNLADRKTIANS